MKKFIALLLTMTMFFAFCVPAYANSPYDVSGSNANGEISCLKLIADIGEIEITYLEGEDGVTYMYEYHNGVLYETTRFVEGNTYFERSFASSSRAASNWEVVDFSDRIVATPSTFAARNTVRDLGYMHYRSPYSGELSSIFCYVSESVNDDARVRVSGTLGTLVEAAAFVAGALGIPASLGTGIISAFVYAEVISLINGIAQAVVSTTVSANVISQTIHGNSTTHSKPEGILTGTIAFVKTDSSKFAGQYFYDGYTTSDWRTDNLGRMMFWQVYGVENVPTSWSSEP